MGMRKVISNLLNTDFIHGIFNAILVKVRLHGTRQAARLARDMLQRDLLRGYSIYMVGNCRARLLHIIHVSAV